MIRFVSFAASMFAIGMLLAPVIAHTAEDGVVSIKKNRNIYAGNTAIGTSPSGRKFRVYYGKDGKVAYKDSKGLSQKGKWVITDDGMMCYDWRQWKDRCYAHRKDGDGYQSYREGNTKGSRFSIAPGKVGLPK